MTEDPHRAFLFGVLTDKSGEMSRHRDEEEPEEQAHSTGCDALSHLHGGVEKPSLARHEPRVLGIHLDEAHLHTFVAVVGSCKDIAGEGAGERGACHFATDVESKVAFRLEGAPVDMEGAGDGKEQEQQHEVD